MPLYQKQWNPSGKSSVYPLVPKTQRFFRRRWFDSCSRCVLSSKFGEGSVRSAQRIQHSNEKGLSLTASFMDAFKRRKDSTWNEVFLDILWFSASTHVTPLLSNIKQWHIYVSFGLRSTKCHSIIIIQVSLNFLVRYLNNHEIGIRRMAWKCWFQASVDFQIK